MGVITSKVRISTFVFSQPKMAFSTFIHLSFFEKNVKTCECTLNCFSKAKLTRICIFKMVKKRKYQHFSECQALPLKYLCLVD